MTTKIPSHAKKVFTGVRFDVYQWQQEMYDGSITTFERARFQDGAFVVPVLPDGQILMTLQEQPARVASFLSLPGGGFDAPDEDPLECAKREFFEETGYESDDWELWLVADGTANVVVNTYFYIARNCRKSELSHELDPGEKIETFILDFDGFLDLSMDPRFHHWTLLPHLFQAKVDKDAYKALKEKLLGK